MTALHRRLLALAGVGLLAAGPARAFDAVANVLSVEPATQQVNRPIQNCWTEYQQTLQQGPPPEHSPGGAVAGAVVGGLLGSLVGHGGGKVASTVVGAGVGAVAGDRIGSQGPGPVVATSVPVQRCQALDHYETVSAGYTVVFEYQGQRFQTVLPNNPGSQLRVRVTVTPY